MYLQIKAHADAVTLVDGKLVAFDGWRRLGHLPIYAKSERPPLLPLGWSTNLKRAAKGSVLHSNNDLLDAFDIICGGPA